MFSLHFGDRKVEGGWILIGCCSVVGGAGCSMAAARAQRAAAAERGALSCLFPRFHARSRRQTERTGGSVGQGATGGNTNAPPTRGAITSLSRSGFSISHQFSFQASKKERREIYFMYANRNTHTRPTWLTWEDVSSVNGTGWAIEKKLRPNKSNLITLRTRDW